MYIYECRFVVKKVAIAEIESMTIPQSFQSSNDLELSSTSKSIIVCKKYISILLSSQRIASAL